jgi:hypothetical protein
MLTTEEKGVHVTFSSYLTENTACFDQKDRQQQCRYIYCKIDMEHTTFLWRIVFDFKRDGKYINHWDVKGFANIDISKGLICLCLSFPSIFIFRFGEIRKAL